MAFPQHRAEPRTRLPDAPPIRLPHFTRSPLHWTKDYIKLSAPDRASLEDWASTLGDVKYRRTCFRSQHRQQADATRSSRVRNLDMTVACLTVASEPTSQAGTKEESHLVVAH